MAETFPHTEPEKRDCLISFFILFRPAQTVDRLGFLEADSLSGKRKELKAKTGHSPD